MVPIAWMILYGKNISNFICLLHYCMLLIRASILITLSFHLLDLCRFEFSVDALVYEIPPSTLVLDLRSYLNNETLCDVTFIVEEHNVNAHKIMLMR